MATEIFARIGDIKGESLDAKHKDEIEVLSFSWGVTNSGSAGSGGGGGTGKAKFQARISGDHAQRRDDHGRQPSRG
jgi:type VI secretion system secreted protein Hcp